MGVTVLIPTDADGSISKVNQDSTCTIEWMLYDDDKVTPIKGSDLDSALMTIYNKSTGDIINSREDEDVVGNFDEEGKFSLDLTAEDNVIISTVKSLTEEVHIAQFIITVNIGAKIKKLTVDYYIYVERVYTP